MRSSSLALIVIVVLGAMTRARAPQTQPNAIVGQASGTASPLQSGVQRPESRNSKPASQNFPSEIRRNIRDFFDQEPTAGPSCESESNWCVPKESQAGVRFLIATVPDPVHSHLSLFFDRIIEAIEQGASSVGYNFDRAVMPWRYFDQTNAQGAEIQDRDRESYPGLMIFRNESANLPLFVLVVGETPTAGINEEQFNHAVEIIHDIGKDQTIQPSENHPEFGILGPTFSGSLYSLNAALTTYRKDPKVRDRLLPVYSAVMGTMPIKTFQNAAPDHVRMLIFEEDAQTIQNALREFACGLGYEDSDIALLSEDETAYGNSTLPAEAYSTRSNPPGTIPPSAAIGPGNPPNVNPAKGTCHDLSSPKNEKKSSDMLNLPFPREISQFRSVYTKEISQQTSTGNGNQPPQNNLRLDLQVTGRNDDSVAPYATEQTPLSQEAVMLGILSELRRRQSKIILVRATDPLDEVFLARYLRKEYPQGRLVVPTPDLLFASGGDGLLSGVLGLNTYPLTPALLNPIYMKPDGGATLLFTAPSVAAVYNATRALLLQVNDPGAWAKGPISAEQGPSKGAGKTANRESLQQSGRGATPDPIPSGLSPDLWLTIVSGNSIYPIKVLEQAESSVFFPNSNYRRGEEYIQRITRLPTTWIFSYIMCFLALCRHAWLSLTGGSFGQWQTAGQFNTSDETLKKPGQRRAWILGLGGLTLGLIFGVLSLAWAPFPQQEHWWLTSLAWAPLCVFVLILSWDFWANRKEALLSELFSIASVAIVFAGWCYVSWRAPGMVLWHQRAVDLGSGVSPTTPLLLVLVAVYIWFWYSLKAEALIDWRHPRLPKRDQLPDRLIQLSDDSAESVRRLMSPISGSWAALIAVVVAACLALQSVVTGPGSLPARSLEGKLYDLIYSIALGVAAVLFIATLLRLVLIWKQLRFVLTSLDRFGFRDALEHLSGFEWHTIWNPAWSVENEGFKLISHELQTIDRLDASLGKKAEAELAELTQLRGDIQRIFELRDTIVGIIRTEAGCFAASRTFKLMPHFSEIQEKFAETAGHLINSYLDSTWRNSPAPGEAEVSGGQGAKLSAARINAGAAILIVGTPDAAGTSQGALTGLSENSTRLAGEFVACVYANFLVSVLLRIRGLVFSAVCIYACIVFSTIFYPFEPATSLSFLATLLFAFGAVAVGYVYEEMHRDATLSRMTSTGPGKLDSGFWIKFVSAGIVPLIGLLASLFPAVSYFLYSTVEPLLQALR